MKKTLILQCPGMVCSPPVVSKCLGEAHRRLGVIYITLDYITLHYITLNPFFFSILLVIFLNFSKFYSRGQRSLPARKQAKSERGSLNSLDLRNGGVALYLEKFQQARTARVCTLALLLNDLEIDSSLLPSLIPSLK